MAGAPRPPKKKAAADAAAEPPRPLSPEELRRQVEERLVGLSAEALHEEYSELFRLAPVGYLTLSAKGIVDDVNRTAAQLLGVKRETLIAQPFSAFVLAADRKEYYWLLQLLKQAEEPQSCELRLQPLGGEPFWAQLEGRPQGAAGDEPRRYRLAFTDVSERVTAQEKLLRSESELRAVIDTVPDAVFQVDRDYRLVFANEGYVQATTATQGKAVAIGESLLALDYSPDVIEAWRGYYDRAFAGESFAEVLTFPLADGTYSTENHFSPVREANGEVTGVVVSSRDITERKAAEAALRETTALLSGLLASIPDIVFFKDAHGVYLGGNAEFARYIGREAVGVVGATDHDLFGVDTAGFYREQDRLMMVHGEPLHNEEWVEYPDGTRVLLDTLRAPLRDVDGQVVGLLGVSRDITARQQVLHQLQERAKELRALYGLTEIAERQGLTADDLCQELTDILPWSWQYPDIACARTVIGEREFHTKGFTDTAWMQSAPVRIKGSAVGRIEVGYREEMPDEDEGPFLKEERQLIDALAERVGRIIERKQAEAALRNANDRLALATRAGGVGLWDYFVTDGTLIWDDQMFALYGITREQFSGAYEAWRAGVHPDDRERGDEEIQLALRGEKKFDTEFRVLWPDGTIRSIRALALVQRDAAGQATHMIGTNWDVTAEKRLAEELRSSEANFRTFFDAVEDVIVVATPEGRLVYANPAFSAKLGYSAEEVTNLHVLDLNPADQRQEAEAVFAAMLRGERASCPLPLQSKSGVLISVETRIWFGVWNGAACVFGVSKDLSAEQEALQKFDRLFHGNPALMAVSSLPEARFTEVNEAFLDTLGYSREEIVGHTTDELGLFVEPEQQRALAEQLQAQGRIRNCELKVRCKDGRILDGFFSGEIIESHGRQYFLTVMIDETERQRVEEALRRSEGQLASAVDGSGVGLWDWQVQSGEAVFNERWAEILGYRLAELAPTSIETWRRLTHPDDLQRSGELLEQHFSGDLGMYECEARMRHADGHWVWLLDRGKVSEWGSDGRPLRMVGTHLDISARKRVEEELRFTRFLVERGGDGIFWATTAGAFRYANTALCELLGYSLDELCTMNIHDIGPPDLGAERWPQHMRELEQAGSLTFETRPRAKDGTIIPMEMTAMYLEYDGDEYYVAFARDISERKLAEKALADLNAELAESEVKYRDVVERASDGIAILQEGLAMFVNESLARMLGYSVGELTGVSFLVVVREAQHAEIAERVRRRLAGEQPPSGYELDLVRKDGTAFTAEVSAGVIAYEGAPADLVLLRDVSARKQAEAALRESEEKHRTILETAMDGFWLVDAEGRLLDVNEAYCQMSGYSARELLGMAVGDLETAETAAATAARIERIRAHGEDRFESRHQRKDGTVFDVEVSVRYMPGGDEGFTVFLRDVTARKQAESYREMGREVLQILNEPADLQDSIRRVLAVVKTKTGLDAVGIRLQDGEDFPYYTQEGFSAGFLRTESSLLERGADGEVRRDAGGHVELECTCGLVLSGKTDASSPLFTPGGSFWTNDSFPLLDLPPDQDPRLNPRNQCMHHGYASMALVPIRSGDGIVGLLHLDDHRKGRFTREAVELLEAIAAHLGEALLRKRAEEGLVRLNDELAAEATALEEANATITRIAATDFLTGLANRRRFHESLETAVSLARRHGTPLALVSLDLDGLKQVNDSVGHEAGDEVLTSFAALLAALCRVEDLPARLGGDEFSVLLTGIDLDGARGLADRVLAAVRFCAALARRGVTVSAGVAQWTQSELPDDLLRRADEALYAAKRGGGDAVAGGG